MLASPLQQVERTMVLHRGRKLIYFGGCDYFRLASHPEVLRALRKGLDEFGLNVAASRSTTGNHLLFGKLEAALARFFGVERAALLSNGYATNLAFTQTFAADFTHAFMDERSHGSLRDAVNALNCPVRSFRHRDPQDFRRRLARCGPKARPIVITDGMFSHDGSIAPLRDYLEALPKNAVLLVDDAHGAGTLGRRGRGTPEVCGVRDPRVVQTISLSKAFGVYGGAILGTAKVIEVVQNRSRIFNGNTPPPLPLVNATLASLRILRSQPALRTRLRTNATRIKSALRAVSLSFADNASPIVSVIPRDTFEASRISRALLRVGVFPPLIRYASTPPPGYFRFAISSEHTREQVDLLAEVLA